MAKKVNLTKGLAGRLIGAATGGVSSAVIDRYVMPLLGDTAATYQNYVKVAIGALAPALIRNQMVTTIGDSLMAIGVANITTDLLGGDTTTDPALTGAPVKVASTYPVFKSFKPSAKVKGTNNPIKVNHVG